MYKVLLALPDLLVVKGGATRTMISICKLLEKSGKFKIATYFSKKEGNDFESIIGNVESRPDIFLCYNNGEFDLYQRKVARSFGCKIVYGLRNCHTSLGSEKMDGCLSSTKFVQQYYIGREGRYSEILPLPIIEEDVVVDSSITNPIYLTMVNPMGRKGLHLVDAILRELWVNRLRLNIPFNVVESTGLAVHFDKFIRGNELFNIQEHTESPKEIYKNTKCVIVPSIWEEPACRVIAESMLNGIPVAYSDRGGMGEVANGGGVCIAIPREISEYHKDMVEIRECAKKWASWVERVWDDKEYYLGESVRGLNASQVYLERSTLPKYVEFFERLMQNQNSNQN